GVWRFANGAWKNMLPNQNGTFTSIAIDPNNAKNVAVSRGGGRIIFRSVDGGDNWSEVQKTVVQSEPAYYPKPKPSNYNAYVGEWGNAALVYDRAGGAWQTNGFGTIYTPNLNTNTPAWEWRMNGFEELVVRKVKVPPLITVPGTNEKGAELFSVVADMIGFRHTSVDQVPAATLGSIDYVSGATSIDFSAQKPEFMAWVGWDQDKGGWWAKRTGYSSDGGKTFTPFANETPGSGGVIAMSAADPQNMVWAPARWARPHVTFDGGKTWKVGIDASTGKELTGAFQLSNEWWTGEVLAADRVDGKRFYYLSTGRMYTSADGGATWTPAAKEFWEQGLPPWWTLDTNLVPNPARAGQVFATFASNTNQTDSFKMFRSDDFGMTFTPVSTVDVVNHMAFGKGDTADTPYMFIHGRVGGATKDGVYRSKDLGATWELVSDPDTNQFAKINTMAADLREKNRVYIGTGGRGIFAGTAPDDAIPPRPSRGVNAGGGVAGNYVADQGFTGGYTFTTDKSVSTVGVVQPAPEAVYRSERFGNNFTYRPLVLAEGRRYLVRLHFAEVWWGV
ncbi:MAG: malectin domain-containing carbohydrate-binding protein, partial [Casimicrobium sp.]